jgi:hypothetical protein
MDMAATLLQSSNLAWNFSVSGPFWYASGATTQVLLFGSLAIELKAVQHTPSARSSLLSGEAGTYDILVLLLPRKSQVHVKTFSTDLVYNGLQVVMGMDSHQCKATFSANGKTFSKAGEYSCGLW